MKTKRWFAIPVCQFLAAGILAGLAPAQEEAESGFELLRATLVVQGKASAPLQFSSYLADGGSARFPVDCGPGQFWVAEVGTKSIKGKGRVLTVEVEDLSRLMDKGVGGEAKVRPVDILAVEIPYVLGKIMSVLETPIFSVTASVSPVGARRQR